MTDDPYGEMPEDFLEFNLERVMELVNTESKRIWENLLRENESQRVVLRNLRKEKWALETERNQFKKEASELAEQVEKLTEDVKDHRKSLLYSIMGDFSQLGYMVVGDSKRQEKCSLCDEDRKVVLTSKDGKITRKVDCDCTRFVRNWVIEDASPELVSYRVDGQGLCFYRGEYSGDWHPVHFIKSQEDFEEDTPYRTFFLDKDLAEKYCEYMNEKEREKEEKEKKEQSE